MDKRNRVSPPDKYLTKLLDLPLADAAEKIVHAVEEGSFSGELLDDYTVPCGGGCVRVLVFEKWYYRVSNRLLLTVTLDDVTGQTRCHVAAGGGGESVFWKFDWFAGDDFADVVWNALAPYVRHG